MGKPMGSTNELAQLREQLAAAQAQLAASKPKFTLKVSPKGAVSVYGLQRFPVTLYREQWVSVLEHAEDIYRFMDANSRNLKLKGE